jgi:pectate lyase
VVYEVTNLNDSGSGSLRACIQASGPRTCVFRVGGTIVLNSSLIISNPFITIAGQTAPGGGIQITNSSSCNVSTNCSLLRIVSGHDIIVRFLRLRFSPESGTNYSDALGIVSPGSPVSNVIFDHLSVAWAEWDGTDIYQGWLTSPINAVTNFTEQNTILAEGNYSTNGSVGAMLGGCGSIPQICDAMLDIDFHHNFLTGNLHRNPTVPANRGRLVDNLVYNSTYYAMKGGGHKDFINNYFKDGPYCCRSNPEIQTWPANSAGSGSAAPDLYVSGNAATSNGFNPNANQWGGATTCANCSATNTLTGLSPAPDNSDTMLNIPIPTTYQRTTPLPVVGVPISNDSALNLATSNGILLPAYPNSQGNPGVGASAKLNDVACDGTWVANRDPLDNRYVSEFNTNTGHSGNITRPGTLPSLSSGAACASSLHDGIADAWKARYALSTTDTTLHQRTAPNGYTYLENYLNGIDPTVATRATSSRSFWASLTSPKGTDGFLHSGLPSFWQRNEAIQLFLSPSADFLRRVGEPPTLPYSAANSADTQRRLELNATASLISN